MVDKEVLERLNQLHEENHHKQILWEISRLPEEVQREYAIQSCKGRALGNLGEYRKAYQVLLPLREEGEHGGFQCLTVFVGRGDYREDRVFFRFGAVCAA